MIDTLQALAIARRAAEAEGWAFVEPVKCDLRKSWRGAPMRWDIRTNAGRRGAIARFVIELRELRGHDTEVRPLLETIYLSDRCLVTSFQTVSIWRSSCSNSTGGL